MMPALGGMVYREPGRGASRDLAHAMAARLPGATAPSVELSGPAAVFAHGGAALIRGAATVAADLEIVNAPELSALVDVTDPAALVARLHEREGWRALSRLRGGFAVAVWDANERALLLGADHFGIKRLYYAETHEGLAFASHASALRAVPAVDGSVDPETVYEYLNFGCVPAPASIFKGIRRLPPGHALLYAAGRLRVFQYWDLAYREEPTRVREAGIAAARQVEDAVGAALAGGAPKEMGAFLSGGTDSSTVVGLMARLTGERVNAFSIGFREPRYDELSYAELAARHFNAAHYTRVISPDDALAALPRLVEAYDEPFGNNSAIGTFFCAGLARECGVKRLLAGDGGDEIFGGNERYATDHVFARYHRVPGALRRGLLEPVLARLPEGLPGPLGKARRYVRRANIPNPRRFYSYEFFFAQEGRALLGPALDAAVAAEAPWRVLEEHFDRAAATSELNRLMYLDMKLVLADSDLVKVTRTASLAGVAVRFPFLDRVLVEFASRLPARLKVRGTEKRYLFKRAFRTLLPGEILAKRKHGFGVPTSLWLGAHPGFRALAHDALGSARARQRGYFRPGAIDELFARHAGDATAFYGDILWTVLMLELWHQRHVDGAGP